MTFFFFYSKILEFHQICNKGMKNLFLNFDQIVKMDKIPGIPAKNFSIPRRNEEKRMPLNTVLSFACHLTIFFFFFLYI